MNNRDLHILRCLDTPSLCAVTSVHPSTLDYWVRTRLVSPSLRKQPGKRRTRLWTIEDVVVVRTIHELRKAGCSLQKVRAAKRYLTLLRDGLKSSTVLVWDGTDIRHVDEWGSVESLVVHPGQQVLHLVALPIGAWEREATDLAKYIRSDRLRYGLPSNNEQEAWEVA